MGLLKKPIVLAIGSVLGLVVAAGLYFTVFSGGGEAEVDPELEVEPVPVQVAGKLGPHIVLEDRVFNLLSAGSAPVFLKLETLIEFETYDERWEHVLHGCAADLRDVGTDLYASAAPGGVLDSGRGQDFEESALSPCQLEEAELLHEFNEEIGTGRQLIEDAVTSIVSGKQSIDVVTPAGKQRLKDEIREVVQQILGKEPRVARVLFTNFITQ